MCTCIVGCQGVVELGGPVFRYYRVVPPRGGGACKLSLSYGMICLTKDLFVVKRFENEKIISQAVGSAE